MQFVETRGNDGSHPHTVSFCGAILSPIASYGGLFSPQTLPELDLNFLQSQVSSSYKSRAMSLLEGFQLDISDSNLQMALDLYDRFDDKENPAPLVQLDDRLFVCELYHGPTRAFKDMALQPFGMILASLARASNQQYLILTATSGDTGPAALEAFRNCDNILVVCLYPAGGTSDVQRLQMVTESARNIKVIGIKGNFDDAQSALKSLLASTSFKQRLTQSDISLSAANSVNFGRILFQIIYHFHAYLELVRLGEIELGSPVNLHIPSGNFGNALGAYYARRMGLPVHRIVIASNANNVLTDWIRTGRYDISSREFFTTTSPAMDILKSSNVERVLFDLFGAQRTRDLMRQLDEEKCYRLDAHEVDQIQAIFSADFCSDEEGKQLIRESFEKGYLMDPHTATCLKTCRLSEFKDQLNIICSTAEWTKFAPVIDLAINANIAVSDLDALESIAARANIRIPAMVSNLFKKAVKHDLVIDKADIEAVILEFLGTVIDTPSTRSG